MINEASSPGASLEQACRPELLVVGCDCIRRVDAQLKEGGHNTMLNTTLFGTPKCLVATVQIESGRGKKKASLMLATHCPFCGTEYPPRSSATPPSQVGAPSSETLSR